MASLRQLVESAFKKYLDASSIGATVYEGFDDENKALPCVVVRAVSAEEEPMQSGNYNVQVAITIKALAGDSNFNSICEAVRDYTWIESEDLGTQLAQHESDLTCWGASAAHRQEWDITSDAWTETQTITVYCAPRSFG